MHGGRLIVRADRAAPAARRSPQTRRTGAYVLGEDPRRGDIVRMQASRGALVIERPGENGLMARYRGDPEALRPLRHKQVTDQRRGRRQQTLGWRIRSVLAPLVGAVDADQQLNLVVVGRDILVTDGPVEPQPVATPGLEVVGAVAQRNPAPVIGPTPQHARPPPFEATRVLFARAHVRLSG